MTVPERQDQVDQFIIYAGYGEVMHRFQVLEMSLWILQARGLNARSTIDQFMAKVEKWNGTALGQMLRGMKNQEHWPPQLIKGVARSGRSPQLPGSPLPPRVLRCSRVAQES